MAQAPWAATCEHACCRGHRAVPRFAAATREVASQLPRHGHLPLQARGWRSACPPPLPRRPRPSRAVLLRRRRSRVLLRLRPPLHLHRHPRHPSHRLRQGRCVPEAGPSRACPRQRRRRRLAVLARRVPWSMPVAKLLRGCSVPSFAREAPRASSPPLLLASPRRLRRRRRQRGGPWRRRGVPCGAW